MKCGIVQSGELTKHRNWSPEFWLGDSGLEAEIERAKARLKLAEAKIELLRREWEASKQQADELERSGKIRIIER